jgi:amphi-Trp domain-containing protein
MESENRSLDFSTYLDSARVAEHLETLARSIKVGHVQLTVGPESVNLHLGSRVKFELEAVSRPAKGKGSLDISMSWREPVEAREETTIQIRPAEDTSSEHHPAGKTRKKVAAGRSSGSDSSED